VVPKEDDKTIMVRIFEVLRTPVAFVIVVLGYMYFNQNSLLYIPSIPIQFPHEN